MAKTVVGLFDTRSEAQSAIEDLVNSGISRGDISLVSNNAETARATAGGTEDDSAAAEGAGAGAVGGTVVGGVLGLLVGLGALAIPGIGPILAAGPLAAAIGSGAAVIGATAAGAGIGAAAGGLLGALVGAGIPEEDAHYYAESVRRGGTLVTVNASDEQANQAYDILNRYNAVDIDERGAAYRSSGWDRFDPNADPYAGEGDWEKSSKVGTAGGTLAGAATGAALGSVAGPVGTVIGGVAGAVTGAGVGAVGDAAGEAAERTADSSYDPADRVSSSGTTYRDTEPAVTGTTSSTVGIPPVVGDPMLGGALGGSSALPVETYTDTTADVNAGSRRRIRTYDSSGAVDTTYGDTATSDAEGAWDRSSKVGTTGGTVAGAATGAAMGSVAGPVGTVIGGIAGAVVGAGVGAAGDAAGEAADEDGDLTTGSNYPATGQINDTTTTRTDYSTSSNIARDDATMRDLDAGVLPPTGTYASELTGRDAVATGGTLADDTRTTTSTGTSATGDTLSDDYAESSKVGTVGGTLAGAATGAAIGSVGGPVGTVIGGVAGAVTGGGVGAAGDAAGEAAEDELLGEDGRPLTDEERRNIKGTTPSDGRKGQVDPT